MYYVKVEGEKISDLIKGLQRHLKELGAIGEITSSASVKVEKLSDAQIKTLLRTETEDDGVEVVEEITFANNQMTPTMSAGSPKEITGELDAEGLPWDERIHASSKTKMKASNTWKIKRGVSDEEAGKIKAEYSPAIVPVVLPTIVQAPLVNNFQPHIVQAPVVVAPIIAPPIPQMNIGNGHTLETFKANFALVIANLITQKKLTQEYMNQCLAYWGVKQIWEVSEAHVAESFETFAQAGLITKV